MLFLPINSRVWRKMGLGLEAINKVAMDVGKSKSRVRRKTLNDDDEDDADTPGCWYKFRFFGSCLSTRAKVDSSVSGSGSSSQYGKLKTAPSCNVFVKFFIFLLVFGEISSMLRFFYIC